MVCFKAASQVRRHRDRELKNAIYTHECISCCRSFDYKFEYIETHLDYQMIICLRIRRGAIRPFLVHEFYVYATKLPIALV